MHPLLRLRIDLFLLRPTLASSSSKYSELGWPEFLDSALLGWYIVDILAWCLIITEKVSFNIASEASYVYILNWQKLIKNAKNCPFWRVFEILQLAVN